MKKTALLLTLLTAGIILNTSLNAQNIQGVVVDSDNNPVEFAAVVVQTTDSVYVDAVYTDSLGAFQLKTDLHSFILQVRHLLYEEYQKEYAQQDVGIIKLNESAQDLSEVLIKGERPLVRLVEGRMTYDMPLLLQDKMASSAYEAVLELPGVSEQNDNITLAGAGGVAVIINGKSTTMSSDQLVTLLKNMPKERIQLAEIMYSAPPQYHVRGAAINLVLTSGTSEEPQLQGQVNAGYSQKHYDSYQAGATLLYSTAKTSTDFLYSFGYGRERTGLGLYSNHKLNGVVNKIEQHNRGGYKTQVHTMRLGNDYFINEKNKLSLVYTTQISPRTYAVEASEGTFSKSENVKRSDNPIQMHNLALSYSSGFGLKAGADYTYFRSHTTQNYQEKMEGKENAFRANSKQNISRVSFYADQTHSLNKGWSLSYGTRFSYAEDKSVQIYHESLTGTNTNSRLDEYTYDLYAGFSKSFSERLSASASLTGEFYKHRDKDYWSLFPTAEVTYIASPSDIFQLSLSSDKSYPSYWEMVNAVSYLNGYAELQGNPNLKPSDTYAVQLNYILRNKYIFTLYGIYTNDAFAQLPYQASDRLALIYKTTNFDWQGRVGLNIILPFKTGSFLDSRLTLNGFYDKVKSSNFHDLSFSKDNFVFYADLNNTLNISKNLKAEITGSYITKNIQGPATLSPLYKVDAGIKWLFDNDNAELKLKVNDMFNSWSPEELKVNFSGQDLNMKIIPDTRNVSLTFTYKFGGYKEKQRKEVDTSRFGSK